MSAPLLFVLARAALPPWGDRLVDIAEGVYDQWDDVVKAAKDGWTVDDDETLSEAVEGSIETFASRVDGYEPGDGAKLGAATAVIVRWIVKAPKLKREALFPKLAARRAARKAAE